MKKFKHIIQIINLFCALGKPGLDMDAIDQ